MRRASSPLPSPALARGRRSPGARAAPAQHPRNTRAAPAPSAGGHLRGSERCAGLGRPLPALARLCCAAPRPPAGPAHLPAAQMPLPMPQRDPPSSPGPLPCSKRSRGERQRDASSAGAVISRALPRNVFMGCQAGP